MEVVDFSLIFIRLPKAYNPPRIIALSPNADDYDIVEQTNRQKPSLTIILANILIRHFEPVENPAGFRQIKSPLSQRPLTLRRVEFDFHIIIVYTIKLKSQARSRFTAPRSSARACPNVR
jgi:hypothetical protein